MFGEVPWIYTLSVLVSDGGFARQKLVAAAANKEDLKTFFEVWLDKNRRIYGGKYQIDHIPFISELVDDA